jgi:LysM repeat protein
MSTDSATLPPPEMQWVKVSGPDALRPLDRHWIRYVRIALLAAAVVIAWRILAWQEDGYRVAAERAGQAEASVASVTAVAETSESATAGVLSPVASPAPAGVPVVVISPTPTPTSTPVPTPTPTPTPTPLTHRVRTGDTLSEIAEYYDVPLEAILAINDIPDPHNLIAGQELRLPSDATVPAGRAKPQTYAVRAGDTLSGIAVRFGVSLQDLMDENELTDPDSIYEGQVLQIPGGTT